MQRTELEGILRENLRPVEYQRQFARRFALNPVHVGIFVCILLGRIMGLVPRELSLTPLWASTLIYTISAGAYLYVVYAIYPYTMRYCAIKRIPFVFHCYIVYLLFLVVYTLLFGEFYDKYSLLRTDIRFLNRAIYALPFVVLMAYVMGKQASIALFGNTEFYPPWKPYKPPLQAIYHKVSPRIVAPIRYIEADSPYVNIVTTKGTERLRMTFKDALNAISKDAGWQIHRSIWVAKDEVANLKYVNGNPKIVLRDGTVLNASREFAMCNKYNLNEVINKDELN